MFHAPSFGDEDFELTATTPLRPSTTTSDCGQQTSTTVDYLHNAGGQDDDKSPTSPDTGCWSSPDVSRSPSCEVEPRRPHQFQHIRRPAGDDTDVCLLKLPPPDEFHIPDIRYSDFYHTSHHQPHQSINIPAVTYTTPPPPPRYPVGYAAMMRPTGSSEQYVLVDGGRLPVGCDHAGYTTPAAPEYGVPGSGVCYNGAGVNTSTTDLLLRHDSVRVLCLLIR